MDHVSTVPDATPDADPGALDEADEAVLAGLAGGGDARAFAALLRRHGDALRGAALRRTKDRTEADDVVQEAALKAWQHLPSLREPAKVRAWLLQIVAREAVRTIAARRHEHEIDEDAARVAGPDLHVDRFDLHDGIRIALRALPEQQARAWLLREAEGLGYREIADRLGASESTVRGWLVLARKRVRDEIDRCCPAARPLPAAAGALLGDAAPVVRPVKEPVAIFPPARADEGRPAAGLVSPLHQDLDLGAPARGSAAERAADAAADARSLTER